MKSVQFIQTSPEQLVELINEGVKNQLQKLKESLISKNENDELLTRTEACEFLKIDSSTLWTWTNKGKIISYGIGSRRYYKRSELLDCLKPLIK